MSVTIKDVAKRANVAPSTVSRVIADSNKISEKTKRRVRKIMEEMGYHANLNARVLVQKATQTLGIVMKHSTSHALDNPFFPEVLRGISSCCHKHDYSLLLTTGESEEANFNDVVKMVQGKRVDAVIVLYSKKDDRVVPYLIEQKFPFVMIGKPLDPNKLLYVDNDNIQAAKEATEFLIQLGHKRVGFIGDDPEFQVIEDRVSGYTQALSRHDIEINKEYIVHFKHHIEENRQIIDQLMKLPAPPTALLVSTDINALTLMSVFREKQIRIPDDVNIITFNNTIVSQLSTPSLTSVDIQTFQLGYEAARSAIELIIEPEMFKRSVIIPTIIKERESTFLRE